LYNFSVPDAQEALGALLVRYIEALVYQGLVENIACEQSSRMIAMKSATDNAGDSHGIFKFIISH
jgi:F-type H+-transporting ATPase subunit gamma